MTLAQLEERLTALEKIVERLQIQGVDPEPAASPEREELLPGVEYSMVLSPVLRTTTRLRSKIRRVDRRNQGLGLSEAEWASLQFEKEGDVRI